MTTIINSGRSRAICWNHTLIAINVMGFSHCSQSRQDEQKQFTIRRNLPINQSHVKSHGFHGRSVRWYSVYPPTYVKPIYREEQLKELEETGEKEKLAFTPIYPAHGDETSSLFHDPVVNKFINHLMRCGRKELARSSVEQTFATIKRIQLGKYYKTEDPKEREKIELNPWKIFHTAIENAGPHLETMSIKRGGHTYQVPVPVKDKRRQFLAMKWLIETTEDKEPTLPVYKKLAWEILDAYNDTGRVVKRKQDLHKVCEANRAYAHYRWA